MTALEIIEEQEEAAEHLRRAFGLSYNAAMIEVLSSQNKPAEEAEGDDGDAPA